IPRSWGFVENLNFGHRAPKTGARNSRELGGRCRGNGDNDLRGLFAMERGFRWVRRCAAVLVWLALPLFLSGCIFTRFLGVGGNNGTGRSLAVEVKASSVNLVVGSHDVATLTAF